ncbi:MAG: NADH-quinone oxidoreductase subunit D [Desulfosoma sp.]|uniref:NADH-quinone oxidoreductase subunit D n=1 Tax=Desulfosoma sp. TaxID=2603217 RepID=UPI00404A6822
MADHFPQPVQQQLYSLNLGPQHPSTHGVLRVLLTLDGEYILKADPVIGYGHRGHEKMGENRTYLQFMPNSSRMDYLSGLLYNHGFCLAVEKLAGIEPPERAKYIRVICAELNRISSHLLWFGTFLMDLGAFTPFLYCFDDRENILDILDRVTGSRLTYSYCRFGGVARDVDEVFIDQTRAFIRRLRSRWPDYHNLVTKNVIFIHRVRGVGIIDKDLARRFGVTGPNLRAAGVPFDMRKVEPYEVYDRFNFEIPTGTRGDALDRYRVRLEEMEQSCRIIEQALEQLPDGAYRQERVRLKLTPPRGDVYFAFESARGQTAYYLVSDGSPYPYRVHVRVPSFGNLHCLTEVLQETLVADAIAILGSIDIVVPEIDR